MKMCVVCTQVERCRYPLVGNPGRTPHACQVVPRRILDGPGQLVPFLFF